MRGRGEEFETVLGLLDSMQQGHGQVLVVEGEPGTRKSLLLARAGEEAGHRGFLLVVAAADELSPAPLLAAVNAARATPGNGAGRRETTAPAPRADVVLAGLEELASAGPVLVTADTFSGPIQPPCRPSGPCHGCWRPTRRPGSWPWARQLTPVRPSCCSTCSKRRSGPDHPRAAGSGGPGRPGRGRARRHPDQGLIELAADAAGNPPVLAVRRHPGFGRARRGAAGGRRFPPAVRGRTSWRGSPVRISRQTRRARWRGRPGAARSGPRGHRCSWPRGIGDGRAGVPVAAPVGGPAIGPRRFQPPSTPPARD